MEHDFADFSSYCIISNTEACQARTPLETAGHARTSRSRHADSVEHLLLWWEGPEMLQQAAVRSCKRRRQLCLNMFEIFPLMMSQRLLQCCTSSSVSGSCPIYVTSATSVWRFFSLILHKSLKQLRRVCKYPPSARADLPCTCGTTVLFNCIEVVEVFPPTQDQEEKVFCDFCFKTQTPRTIYFNNSSLGEMLHGICNLK